MCWAKPIRFSTIFAIRSIYLAFIHPIESALRMSNAPWPELEERTRFLADNILDDFHAIDLIADIHIYQSFARALVQNVFPVLDQRGLDE